MKKPDTELSSPKGEPLLLMSSQKLNFDSKSPICLNQPSNKHISALSQQIQSQNNQAASTSLALNMLRNTQGCLNKYK